MKLKTYNFIDVITAAFIFFMYSLVGKYILPKGVNLTFATRSWKYFLLLFVVLVLVFILFLIVRKAKIPVIIKRMEKLQSYELVYILIPMTPIVQYIILNREILYISSIILIIIFFSLLSFVFCIGIPYLLSCVASRYILISAGTAFLYFILSMVTMSVKYGWFNKGTLKIQFPILLSIFLILVLTKYLPKKIIIGAVVINLLINSFSSMYIAEPVNKTENQSEEVTVGRELEKKEIKKSNDIFLFVYEAYSDYQTMKYYGYDNSAQISYLEESGFHIYQGIYSLGMPTLPSMSNVFNIDSDIHYNRKYVIGGGNVHKILKRKGYKLYGVFDDDYFFIKMDSDQIRFDYAFPPLLSFKEDRLLIKSILAGRFYGHAGLEEVGLNSYLNEVEKIIKSDFKDPIFFYTHNPFPGHSPPKEYNPDGREKYIKSYIHQVNAANSEMKKEIDLILKHNPDAIVIIAGDHGPSLTKSGYGLEKGKGGFTAAEVDRYDLQDRFGTFLAIRWPEKNYALRYDVRILQDIFPAVFAYLFEDDEIFNKIRMERKILNPKKTLGVSVENGIISGGINDSEPLFLNKE